MPISERSIPRVPPNAKCVAGVWIPETEERYASLLTEKCRLPQKVLNGFPKLRPSESVSHRGWKRPIIDGKAAIGYRWIQSAQRLCKRRRVAVDVGANVGFWSMWLVGPFSHVHAFEPVPDLAAILPWNMPRENYTLHNCALGKEDGYVTMTVDPAATGYSHVGVDGASSSGHPVIPPVPMRTLDSFEIQEVDLLKIDVEGYELQVLYGAERTIRSCRPIIVIEQNGHEERYGVKRDSALRLLKNWGARERLVIKGDYFLDWPC